MENYNMDRGAPVLIRIYKEERTLEVWKQDRTGKFAPLQSYPICKFSGKLGPKIAQGDYQAPEGFYDITPAQMNPQSSEYLSFNIGFPNAFDRSLGRTGSFLMVHGGCRSVGCYAMIRLSNGRDLRPGRGSIQRRPGQSSVAGLSLPNDRGKFDATLG
jgi:murein L,D-transpeptidase YafK